MAQRKKAVDDFQKALLTNTKFIKNHIEEPQINDLNPGKIPVLIEKNTDSQFKILANYLKINKDDLIEEALVHFLKIKNLKLEKAILELTKEK